MSTVHPTVRYLIVCEDVKVDPQKASRISLIGLIGAIEAREHATFPLVHSELCVYLQLTECRGPATCRIEVQRADTSDVVSRTPTHTIALPTDPLAVVGFTFRIHSCRFPESGLYWFQFWYNEQMLAQQPVLLR
jgi:hypothetical protein